MHHGFKVSVPLRGNGCETLALSKLSLEELLVSVPLRGNGCETMLLGLICFIAGVAFNVSVPLRGNGCETERYCRRFCFGYRDLFPSPCGVMGVKLGLHYR